RPPQAQRLRGDDEPARRAHLRDLLDRDERHERARADPAVLLVVEDPEDLVLAEEVDDVPRELGRLVDLARPWSDPLPRELADQLADLALLVAERFERRHGSSLARRIRRPARRTAGATLPRWGPPSPVCAASSGRTDTQTRRG